MIATCPSCRKRYRLADDAVPGGGRPVRCVACGHAWTVLPGDATADGGAGTRPAEPTAPSAPSVMPAAAAAEERPLPHPAPLPDPDTLPARPSPAAPVRPAAPDGLAAAPDGAPAPRPAQPAARLRTAAPRRRRWGWVIALIALLAIGALAVVEFAPDDTFDPPRLGLPAPHLPLADLGSIAVPTLPPLDLTRVPVVGDTLDRLIHPLPTPASPLRITAHGERRTLANGTRLLTITGTVANPTAATVTLAGIDAALLDPAGHLAFHWRIAAPASVIAAHGRAEFEATAANYPAGATLLQLTPR